MIPKWKFHMSSGVWNGLPALLSIYLFIGFSGWSLRKSATPRPHWILPEVDWFNGHYIRTNSDTELTRRVKPYVKDSGIEEAKLPQIVAITRERLVKLSDFPALTAFFYTTPSYNPDLWKDPAQSLSHLTESLPVL